MPTGGPVRPAVEVAAWTVTAVGLVAIVVMVAFAVSGPSRRAAGDIEVTHADGWLVTYEVEGTATDVDVVLSGDALGDDVHLPGAELPLVQPGGGPYEGTVFPGQFTVDITARITSGGGEVTCRIVVDGAARSEVTASGDGAVAHCTS